MTTGRSKLLEASPRSGRVVLNVGDLLGLGRARTRIGGISRRTCGAVIAQITAAYQRSTRRRRAYFAARRAAFETAGLARYDELRAQINAKYAGVPVGYSESIFQGLGEDLHLKLLTPTSFAKAIAEGRK